METASPSTRMGKIDPISSSPLDSASEMELTRPLKINTNAAGNKLRSTAVITTPDVSLELVAQVSLKAQEMVEMLV